MQITYRVLNCQGHFVTLKIFLLFTNLCLYALAVQTTSKLQGVYLCYNVSTSYSFGSNNA